MERGESFHKSQGIMDLLMQSAPNVYIGVFCVLWWTFNGRSFVLLILVGTQTKRFYLKVINALLISSPVKFLYKKTLFSDHWTSFILIRKLFLHSSSNDDPFRLLYTQHIIKGSKIQNLHQLNNTKENRSLNLQKKKKARVICVKNKKFYQNK